MPKRIIVKRYKNEREYQRDAQKWIRRGYSVTNVVSQTPRRSFFGFLMLGLFSRKPELIVTYSLASVT